MLESTESLLPRPADGSKLKVACLGIEEESLDELDRLLTTLGVSSVGRLIFSNKKINPATYIGTGKLDEMKAMMEALKADALIVDVELSPNQLRNVEKYVGKPVVDRPGVIIEIFSRHARTKEAKVQVELAKLQYLLPRLAHFWTHFERQRGGIGLKGMGEKQIEVDRRLVKKRMALLRERLADIEKERSVQRAGRSDVLKVALVGYTNAGKSTLLNSLTQSSVRAEDKLFATLDPSVRSLDPFSHPPIVAIDTVGFISNLPHSLVASFRSTLEELHQADLLLHVVDGSSPQAREQYEVTEPVLKDLGLENKPRLTVLNKADLVEGDRAARNLMRLAVPGAVSVSAFREEDVKRLRELILEQFKKRMGLWEVLVPYGESKLEAQLHAYGSVERTKHLDKGTFFRVFIDEGWAKKLELEKYRL